MPKPRSNEQTTPSRTAKILKLDKPEEEISKTLENKAESRKPDVQEEPELMPEPIQDENASPTSQNKLIDGCLPELIHKSKYSEVILPLVQKCK
jgi:hypothetical protein